MGPEDQSRRTGLPPSPSSYIHDDFYENGKIGIEIWSKDWNKVYPDGKKDLDSSTNEEYRKKSYEDAVGNDHGNRHWIGFWR